MYSFLCDRIDKGKQTHTLQGGLYGLQYGYAANFYQVIDQYVPCNECYQLILTKQPVGKSRQSPCPNNCYAFDHDVTQYKLDEKQYPKNLLKLKGNPPYFQKVNNLSTNNLIKVCNFAFESVIESGWTQTSTVEYLKTEGINEGTSKLINIHANNKREYNKFITVLNLSLIHI